MNFLLEEKANIYKEIRINKRQEYEEILVKYEANIREHFKIEQQMKLYIDSLETQIEELKYKNKLKKIKIEELSQKLNSIKNIDEESLIIIKQEESSIMNSSQDTKTENEKCQFGKFRKFEEEILQLKAKIQKYEEQNKNLSNNIKKLKEENNNKIKEIENKYKKENKSLKKQLLLSENKIKQLTELNSNSIYNNKSNQSKTKINTNKNNNSIQNINGMDTNNSMYKISSKEKDDLSIILNKTTKLKKSQSSLSVTSSIDRIEKYLRRKYTTLKAQKSQRISTILKFKKIKKKNNSMIKKKTEDLMKLFLNDSNHRNFTERIRSNKNIQKSENNKAYYSQYCNKIQIKKNKKSRLKEKISSNANKKTRSNLDKKTNIKNNIFEMINNINNINIFATNLKQSNYNNYSKLNNSNSSFSNNYKNDILKQYNNNTYNRNFKKSLK